ncbi:amidohydrolase family protein [Pseudonocardia nematodicida]|uniref:Amidohydrolase family protein n=1 Tax=Pseudonocardia nematodicida TaxID=1206997 RepID=A0ABV1KH54_9PSEU
MTDLLLRDVRPVGGASPASPAEPVDVLVRAGRIVAVGAALHVEGAPEVVEAGGRALLPGLWDHHVHAQQWALARRRLDVSGTGSAAECTQRVADRLVTAPPAPGEVLVGFGYRDALWPDAAHRDLLDRVSGDVPVVLIAGDLHQGWLNGAALEKFGHRGHPTGRIRESEFFAVTVALSDVPSQTLDAFVADAVAAASARGVVGIVDFEAPWSLPDWRRRVEGGTTGVRVEASVWPEHLDDGVATGLRTGDPVPGTGGLVTAGPLKVITDGSLNTRTAYCYDPYPVVGEAPAHPCGMLLVPPGEVVPLLERAHAAGLEAALHAIGDHANTLVLDAFAATGARGRVEHAQLLAGDDVPRFAALGLIASVQPEHALDDRDVADRLWAGRTGRSFAYAALHDAGARLALGSDAPVAPLDPWIALAAAVHRTADDRDRWHPEQELDRSVALAASYGVVAGSTPAVEPGARADLVLADADPLTCDPAALRAMPVAGTLVGGRWTHRAGI